MNEKDHKNLLPNQSADTLRYFHTFENSEYRARGWEDRVSLGRSAIHIANIACNLQPDGKHEPLLNIKEAGEGLDYLKQNPPTKNQPIESAPKSEAYYIELARRVDTRGISYDEARRELDEEGWE